MVKPLQRVCVVGIGRVGLPLALSLQEQGLTVTGIERDAALRAALGRREMPFREPGFAEVLAAQGMEVTDDYAAVAEADAVVITVGTPLREHIETDLSQIQAVLDQVIPRLTEGTLVVLRSTVAPGTTEYVRRTLEQRTPWQVGEGVLLAFCPERLAEGKAREELRTLPQIIGAADDVSRRRARELFAPLGAEALDTDYRGAELTKLFNNISRYVYFAVSNQLTMVAESFGANIHEILHLANYKYPRGIIASPGLTAGSCLRKDFGMINEFAPYPDLLLSAWKVNEYVPRFLVEAAQRQRSLHGAVVAVLGYSFKRGADDLRDSLVPKLVRTIEREVPAEVRVCEPNLQDLGERRNWPFPAVLTGADFIFIAVDHEEFTPALLQHAAGDALVVDLWNCTRQDSLIYQVKEHST